MLKKMDIFNTNSDNKHTLELNSTAKGMLHKYISNDGGYYYKSGFCDEYGDYEDHSVIAECIAYEMGKELGLNVLKQQLVYYHDILACKSKNFLEDDENIVTFAQMGISTYKDMEERLSEHIKYFNSILIFDFIINNKDRHLNNIGLIKNHSGIYREPPIFDNGSSLFYDLSRKQLTYIANHTNGHKKYDSAKPFCRKHYNQIDLVFNNGILPDLNLDIDIDSIVCKYYQGARYFAITRSIKERLEYVKQLYKR